MTYGEQIPFETPLREIPHLNGAPIEVMSSEELAIAQHTLDILTQAVYARREALSSEHASMTASVEQRQLELWRIAHTASQRELAKQNLADFQQSPKGKAIIKALSAAYEDPGIAYNVTKRDYPLIKDSLALTLQDVFPELIRTVALNGCRGDIDKEIDVPVTHIKGLRQHPAQTLANRLTAKFYGSVSDLAIRRQDSLPENSDDDRRTVLFDFLITKRPTGKPTFEEQATVRISTPLNYADEGATYELLTCNVSSIQRHYTEEAQQAGWSVAAYNIAHPYNGGLASPR